MVEYFAQQLTGWYSGFGVFGYLTLRSVLAALTGAGSYTGAGATGHTPPAAQQRGSAGA